MRHILNLISFLWIFVLTVLYFAKVYEPDFWVVGIIFIYVTVIWFKDFLKGLME